MMLFIIGWMVIVVSAAGALVTMTFLAALGGVTVGSARKYLGAATIILIATTGMGALLALTGLIFP